MMVVLLLYAYCVGMPSSRKIERACYEDLPFRVLSGNQQPDHTRISEFRRRHLELLEDLFVQVLRLCQKAGLVQMGHVALDGTKVEANASIHKAMSHERMEKSEQQLRQEMRALLRKAEIIDAQEDGRYGKGKRGSELPEELQRRESRLKKIRQAKAELEAEAAAAQACRRQKQADAAATEAEQGDDDSKEKLSSRAQQKQQRADTARALALQKLQETGIDPETVGLGEAEPMAMPTRGLPSNAQGKPSPKAQRNFTDPGSHVMKCGNGYIQGYNAQAAVDSKHQVIVAIGVSNQAPDVEHLVPMLERIEASTGTCPRRSLRMRATGARPTPRPAAIGASMPTSPPGARSMASSEHHHGVRSQSISTPRGQWPESSEARTAVRSMPGARRSSSRCLVRPRKIAASGASC